MPCVPPHRRVLVAKGALAHRRLEGPPVLGDEVAGLPQAALGVSSGVPGGPMFNRLNAAVLRCPRRDEGPDVRAAPRGLEGQAQPAFGHTLRLLEEHLRGKRKPS